MSDSIERIPIRVQVNGKTYQREVEPRTLLVDFIRNELDFNGTHIGCETSYCGACTVLLNGRAIKSCTVFAAQADRGEVETVEGLESNGQLHPLQTAFSEKHALQCGYCTPGFLMSAKALLAANSDPSENQIRKALAGNICRCTGYQNILTAVRDAARVIRES